MLSEGTTPLVSDSKGIRQCTLVYYRAMIASFSPLDHVSILNGGNSLKWDSQFHLHSKLVRCELWISSNSSCSAASFTDPKVRREGHLPKSGIPGDNRKFLMTPLPCPAPLLIAGPSNFISTLVTLGAVLFQGCVCSLVKKEKEWIPREDSLPHPWYCCHLSTGHLPSLLKRRWPELPSEAMEPVQRFPSNKRWRSRLFFIFSNLLWTKTFVK